MEQACMPRRSNAVRSETTDRRSVFPSVPRKFISEDYSLVEVFRRSASFAKIIAYVQGCGEAVESYPHSARLSTTAEECCPAARFFVQEYFPVLREIVAAVPLEDLTQQRFGNRAKRIFHERFNEMVAAQMERLARTFPPRKDGTTRSEAEVRALAVEMAEYAKDSWGNPTRLDYGTGHELHFFILIMICLEEHGDDGGTLRDTPTDLLSLSVQSPPPVPVEQRERIRRLRQDFVFYVFWEYMGIARLLQKHYSLEPAGSHGVWGLDDYHHIPYIFGAAQLIGKEDVVTAGSAGAGAILPKHICERSKVTANREEYMYFEMIAWIIENKTGPFFEHSNMLYNISGVGRWEKIYTGMIKMFAAEVLAKFNVSQHLLFGRHLPWNTSTFTETEKD